VNGFFDVMMGLVDVHDGSRLQALGEGVVLFLSDVTMGFVDQFEGAVKAAGPIHVSVDRRMIVDVLTVVDGSFLDFVDGIVDFVDGQFFVFAELAAVRMLKVRSRMAQILQGVDIGRMLFRSGRLGIGGEESRDQEKRCGYCDHERSKFWHFARMAPVLFKVCF
jgi:hypothetical protein